MSGSEDRARQPRPDAPRRPRAMVRAISIGFVLGVALLLSTHVVDGPPLPEEEGPASPSSSPSGDAAFVHPGVVVTRGQLESARARIARGQEPTAAAFDRMMESDYASLSHTASPHDVVECGPHSDPDVGCGDERRDAIAAYTHALAWYFTKDARHARKSVEIMGAWSAQVTDHTGSNAPLQSAWTASLWARAGEIVRHTYSGWPAGQIDRFENMLRVVYLPEVDRRSQANGNWELAMAEATLSIAVFVEDRATFDRGLDVLRDRVPAYVYLSEDGPVPRVTSSSDRTAPAEVLDYWHDPLRLSDGMTQETCRDLGHAGYGLASISHATETAAVQGADLYPEIGPRLAAALELHANLADSSVAADQLCSDASADAGPGPLPESAFTPLGERFGCPMDAARALAKRLRPIGTDGHLVVWEDLTHGTALSGEITQDGSEPCAAR